MACLTTLEICAGVGMLGEGLRAGLRYLGIPTRTVCYIEREAYPSAVLAARGEDESLDAAPVWSDLLTFDAGAWRGTVDCIVAGFPCQDLSVAGRRAGLDGKRSGLFFDILRIATDCEARWLFLENVAGISTATAAALDKAAAAEITGQSYRPAGSGSAGADSQIYEEDGAVLERAAARVVGELASLGWNSQWLTLRASDVGASHGRKRWFCFAWRRSPVDDTEGKRMREHEPNQRPSAGNVNGATGASALLGDSRLQYQHLQQRPNGPEHPGASGELGNPKHNGQPAQQKLPSHEVPSHNGRPEEPPAPGQPARADRSADDAGLQRCDAGGEQLANTQCRREQRPGIAGELACASPENQADNRCRQRPPAHDSGHPVANSHSQRLEGRRASSHAPGWQEPDGHARLGSRELPLFAPGPSSPAWPAIIAEHPHVAPALESDFHGVVNGQAFAMDESRAERLKCCGNGVVALQAAAAFVQLFRRAQGVAA